MFKRQTHTRRDAFMSTTCMYVHKITLWGRISQNLTRYATRKKKNQTKSYSILHEENLNFLHAKYEPDLSSWDSTLTCVFVFSFGFLMQDRKYTNPKPAGKPWGSACVSSLNIAGGHRLFKENNSKTKFLCFPSSSKIHFHMPFTRLHVAYS